LGPALLSSIKIANFLWPGEAPRGRGWASACAPRSSAGAAAVDRTGLSCRRQIYRSLSIGVACCRTPLAGPPPGVKQAKGYCEHWTSGRRKEPEHRARVGLANNHREVGNWH
jgi:hypothetical protein